MSGMLQEILLCTRKILSIFELLEEEEKFREEESKQVQEEFKGLPYKWNLYKGRRKYFFVCMAWATVKLQTLQNFVWKSASCLVSLVSISALFKFGTIKPVAQYLPYSWAGTGIKNSCFSWTVRKFVFLSYSWLVSLLWPRQTPWNLNIPCQL